MLRMVLMLLIFPLGLLLSNNPYVRAYFPHSDWGTTYNGNYMKDIRSINPASKPGILLSLKTALP